VTTPAPEHTLFQITDPHLRAAGELLRYGVETYQPLAAVLAAVEQSAVRPTALLLTGDLADDGQPAAYRRLRSLVEPLAERIGAPVIYLAGNHDRRPELREHLLDEPPDSEPLDRVHRFGGLRVIALDSSVPGAPHGELSPAQLGRLAAELADPAPDGTVLALHHPPLPNPSPLLARIALREPAALAAVLAGTDVRIVLGGHTHLVSAGALAGIPVWTGGSTAYAYDALPPGGGERLLRAPTLSRIDLFAGSLVATAVPVGAEPLATLDAARAAVLRAAQ
jgi:3',5'-cyclic AMP phosphodiesterase CpdA